MEVLVLLWKMHPSERLNKFSSSSGQEKAYVEFHKLCPIFSAAFVPGGHQW